MYKEAAYILERHNRKDEVLTTLIDELGAFEEAVKYVVKYHPDDHKSWKYLFSKAKGDTSRILFLVKDLDFYNYF